MGSVWSIWLSAAKTPFRYPLQLLKFGAVPIAVFLAAEMIASLVTFLGWVQQVPLFLFIVVAAVANVPFDVAWNRLVINGAAAVVVRGYYPFRRAEVRFLVAVLSFRLIWLTLYGPVLLIRHGRQTFDHHMVFEGGILLLVWLLGATIVVFRLVLALPALAINRYAGIKAVWLQSQGKFERIVAIVALARLPYVFAIDLIGRLVSADSMVLFTALVRIIQAFGVLLAEATAVAAIALVYKAIVSEGDASAA